MTPSDIVHRIASARGFTVSRVRSSYRWRSLSSARAEAVWVLREATELSFPEAGRMVGMRNHTSALKAWRKIQALVDVRPEYGDELLALATDSTSGVVASIKADIARLSAELSERTERLRVVEGAVVVARAA